MEPHRRLTVCHAKWSADDKWSHPTGMAAATIAAVKTLLMIAFHFPPLVGSSGIQRTLRFAQYLPEFGWKPVVLAPSINVYQESDPNSLSQVPAGCEIVRVPSLDTGRHLAIAGRYPGFLALPDRWASWSWLAPTIGANACRRLGVDAIWSTYPIATAHRIGARIARRTGLPWMADFRDPMLQDGYPEDPTRRFAFKKLEDEIAAASSRMVFVTPSARATYRARYPALPDSHFEVIENGYDESVFAAVGPVVPPPRGGRRLVILHSGIVYPSERDPTALMQALGQLKTAGRIAADKVVFRFRASVHDDLIVNLAARYGVSDLIEVAPSIPYRDAVAEMLAADGLMVLQANNCNEQIPAKVYEYVRAERPILGLADPIGETGLLLLRVARGPVAALESAAMIEHAVIIFLSMLESDEVLREGAGAGQDYSRHNLTRRLCESLDELTNAPRINPSTEVAAR